MNYDYITYPCLYGRSRAPGAFHPRAWRQDVGQAPGYESRQEQEQATEQCQGEVNDLARDTRQGLQEVFQLAGHRAQRLGDIRT